MQRCACRGNEALLKTLIAEIRVEGDEAARLHRLPPAGVRIVGALVGRTFRNANQAITLTGTPMKLR